MNQTLINMSTNIYIYASHQWVVRPRPFGPRAPTWWPALLGCASAKPGPPPPPARARVQARPVAPKVRNRLYVSTHTGPKYQTVVKTWRDHSNLMSFDTFMFLNLFGMFAKMFIVCRNIVLCSIFVFLKAWSNFGET